MSKALKNAHGRKGAVMRTGKISESILKRSILRQIKNYRDEIRKGAGVGEDCAFFTWKSSASMEDTGQDRLAVSTQTITFPVRRAGYLAVMAAANNLAASGAQPLAVTLALTFPPDAEEAFLKETMRQAENCCAELDIQIVGGHTEVSQAVNSPVISATVMGKAMKSEAEKRNAAQMDIVMSKWIGLEGTAILADEKEKELTERYPISLIQVAKECGNYLSIASEAAIALKSGVYAMHDVRNGGVFGALWELSRKIGVGLNIDLKKIPVRQETIEVCEFYDLNPYEFLSGGALLMVTEDGDALVEALEQEGISAAVIGMTTGGNDKIIRNQDETRYLEPTVPDEIWKIDF